MRHSILTCKNHPELRWSCKCIAVDENAKPGEPARYNGMRNIRFNGRSTGEMFADQSGLQCTYDVAECTCPPSDLIIAPEDPLVKR